MNLNLLHQIKGDGSVSEMLLSTSKDGQLMKFVKTTLLQ